MGPNGNSEVASGIAAPTPFLQLVNDICDRVLKEAQMAGNVLTIQESVDEHAVESDRRKSDPQSPTV